jgi:hypothetical protein
MILASEFALIMRNKDNNNDGNTVRSKSWPKIMCCKSIISAEAMMQLQLLPNILNYGIAVDACDKVRRGVFRPAATLKEPPQSLSVHFLTLPV